MAAPKEPKGRWQAFKDSLKVRPKRRHHQTSSEGVTETKETFDQKDKTGAPTIDAEQPDSTGDVYEEMSRDDDTPPAISVNDYIFGHIKDFKPWSDDTGSKHRPTIHIVPHPSLSLDDVRGYGGLDRDRGISACAGLFRAPGIEEKLGAALWEKLKIDAEEHKKKLEHRKWLKSQIARGPPHEIRLPPCCQGNGETPPEFKPVEWVGQSENARDASLSVSPTQTRSRQPSIRLEQTRSQEQIDSREQAISDEQNESTNSVE